MPKCIIKTFFIPNRKQNDKNGMNYLKRDEKTNKQTNKRKKNSNIRAARNKVFPHWLQKQL